MKYEITPQDYQSLKESGTPHVLLDVRQNWELQKAKLNDALHIPLTDLLENIDDLKKSDKIIVYCHHGVRSMNACLFLRELGFEDVLSLAGGIDAWSNSMDHSVPTY